MSSRRHEILERTRRNETYQCMLRNENLVEATFVPVGRFCIRKLWYLSRRFPPCRICEAIHVSYNLCGMIIIPASRKDLLLKRTSFGDFSSFCFIQQSPTPLPDPSRKYLYTHATTGPAHPHTPDAPDPNTSHRPCCPSHPAAQP